MMSVEMQHRTMMSSSDRISTTLQETERDAETAWNRINDLVEKVAELERTNCKLQSRYERQLEVSDPSLDEWKSTKELQTSHSDGVLDVTISEELNAALKREKQLVHQLASAENQVSQLESDIEEISSNLVASEKQIIAITEELTVNNELLNERQQHYPQQHQQQELLHEQQVSKLNQEVEELLKHQKAEYQDVIEGLTEDLCKTQDELAICQNKLEESEEEWTKKKSAMEQSQNELAACQDKFEKYKAELERTNSQLEDLEFIHSRCPEVHEQLIQQQRTEKLEQLPPQNEQIQQVEHLQSVVHGFESQLRSMKDLTESFNHLSPRSQELTVAESDRRLTQVADEFEHVKTELEKMMTHYSNQRKLNSQLKLHSKTKYNQLRRTFKSEQTLYQEQQAHLERELRFLQAAFEKERELRQRAEVRNEELCLEHREMLSLLTDQTQQINDSSRQVALLQDKSERSEQDNSKLSKRIESLTARIHELDCISLESSLNQELFTRSAAM